MFDDIYNTAPPAGATKTERLNSSAETRKKNSKRNSYRLIMIISSVILAILMVAALFFLRIKSVVIINDGFYDTEKIEMAANDGVYRHMFFPRSNSLKSKLEKEFPYLTLDTDTFVKDYSTQTLTVTTVYIEPAFCVEWNSKYLVLSENCKILDDSAQTVTDGIPLVTGAKLTSAEAGEQAAFAESDTKKIISDNFQMLKDAGIDNIKELDISDKRDIKVILTDGGTILLGTSDISKTKTAFLKELYNRHKNEETKNLYVIEIKNNEDGYIKVLDETLPETTIPEETKPEETAEQEDVNSEESHEDTTQEETTEEGYVSPLYELQLEEESAEAEETTEEATEVTTEEESAYVSPLYELQMQEESAENSEE